jgi:hypothetical protein
MARRWSPHAPISPRQVSRLAAHGLRPIGCEGPIQTRRTMPELLSGCFQSTSVIGTAAFGVARTTLIGQTRANGERTKSTRFCRSFECYIRLFLSLSGRSSPRSLEDYQAVISGQRELRLADGTRVCSTAHAASNARHVGTLRFIQFERWRSAGAACDIICLRVR